MLYSAFYLLQCVQVNINSNLRPQFTGQTLQHLLFVYSFLIAPQVVKPADDTLLQLLADMSEMHVVFQRIYAALEGCSCCVHIGDHRSNIPHNGGKNQNTNLKQICQCYGYKLNRIFSVFYIHAFTGNHRI